MKFKLLILVLFSPISIFAQAVIVGRMLDKEDLSPIANAFIYSEDYKYSTQTDENGNYRLQLDENIVIHFTQLAYYPVVISVDSLKKESTIVLKRNMYELQAVVISPIHAEE